jgi:hypothetical protein
VFTPPRRPRRVRSTTVLSYRQLRPRKPNRETTTLSPPQRNIQRLSALGALHVTVTGIRLASIRGCLGISISSTPSL